MLFRILVAWLLLALPAAADEDQLWDLLAAQTAMAGEFEQLLYDEEGELVERSSGRYAVLRPGYFRWEISTPDRQLLLVSGDQLWHYDVDLATATRRDSSGDRDLAALELLSSEPGRLRERFAVTELGESHYRLEPTYAGAGFAAVDMRWSEGRLTAMNVVDRSGQRLQLALDPDAAVGPSLSPDDFRFVIPDGVEVYYDDGA